MENSGNDDSRKKRDSTDVVEGDSKQSEEKTKKLRAAKQRPNFPSVETVDNVSTKQSGRVQDLEVSLQKLVNVGGNYDSKEYLSQSKWVKFHIGHAGDASTLATLYKKSKMQTNEEFLTCEADVHETSRSQKEETSLEVRLAEGLGDEDSPPSIYALLADVVDDRDGVRGLGAGAVISSGWEDSTKVMRVKMFFVSDDDNYSDVSDLLGRRMWLRLSALALMTSNEMVVERGVTTNHSAI